MGSCKKEDVCCRWEEVGDDERRWQKMKTNRRGERNKTKEEGTFET